jgi:hypothetical protein
MKKLLTLAAVAASLAFCALGAQASIGITTNYTPLNVSFIITTNGPTITNGTVITHSFGKLTWNNATLLNIFAHWANTNWPAGSKLVIGWDEPWVGAPLVVDKSGTNVLYDTYDTGKDDCSFYIEFGYDFGPYTQKAETKNPGSKTETYHVIATFDFSDPGVYLPDTSLSGIGEETITYTQNWDKNHNFTTWSQKINIAPIIAPQLKYLDKEYDEMTGSFESSGSGKGESYFYLYSYEFNDNPVI